MTRNGLKKKILLGVAAALAVVAVVLVIKWKELYDKIEDAIDHCEDVGNVLQSISLKNA